MNKNMMRQMQQMQGRMQKLQEELGELTVEGTAGGSVVKITIDGHQNVRDIEISPEIVDPEQVDMLQEIVLSAINDAVEKSKKLAEDKMASITGGLNLPGL